MLTALVAAALIGQAPIPCADGAMPAAGEACPIFDPFILFFDWNSAAITPASADILDNVVGIHPDFRNHRIDMLGTADRSGGEAYNLHLSQRRIDAVRRYLQERGVPPSAFGQSVARGESLSLVETADGVREPQNRFVTVGFVPAPD